MKRILGGVSVVLALLALLVALAGALLGAGLALGWLLSRVLPFDLFQGALLGLFALGFAAVATARLTATALAHLASNSSRPAASGAARRPASPEGALGRAGFDDEGRPEESSDSPRRRGRPFDA